MAYPRSRGGTADTQRQIAALGGLSPLTRGNLVCRAQAVGGVGPIPAHAGEPLKLGQIADRLGAYPRSRGGTFHGRLAEIAAEGLSPLTRGNQSGRYLKAAAIGPIPAHAGEPAVDSYLRRRGWAYPRSRGGTDVGGAGDRHQWGLSPLTRGNLYAFQPYGVFSGPIPAHAGEPPPHR